ncbi:putative nuclease HARBI1 [Coccinella septempunctata]|uniref:putative nuclease HARBI1 n=1 Tax=Coccinella septempunctata TaxID=41139 RepID=UPI001D088689|nr:putative nuclease HARBI1 [Coccinella septempunctata]
MSSLSSLSDGETTTSRNIPDRKDLWNRYDDNEFRSRFRFNKPCILHLLSKIEHLIEPETRRSKAIDARTQLLIVLRYYATGSFQAVLGDLVECNKSTMCRIIQRVTKAITSLADQQIKMPTSEEYQQVAQEFYEIAAFPRVLGAVDCTHVKINSPGGHLAETFRCRKGFFSINVQIVYDARLKIRNIIARWPGSVHDSTIFNNSPLCAMLENGAYGNFYLIGDSGYFCKRYLLTPFLSPSTTGEENYNKSHILTRNTVERCIGVWKRRFPCIQKGITLKKMDTILKVIVATAVLHNMAISFEEEEFFEVDLDQEELANHISHGPQDFSVRSALVNTVFN